ncbi:sugar MFS transporter [Polymorphobacter fuscus]|uniref:Glucose/galactose MFS transporter n=1 Tax=Sandarakinorhabdus fusca TaxID=1439888 RepID=A0A7C9KXT3_9SPHN|nr:sugar MFS transporter [Polymorphobacter fuscus]KAB7644883.1 sugar MFS transporter [Polymorphobacter fuscus]MQT18165.1 glucose/galactose MFS transporter [Polymorphobacter fuscus]NJC09483.1 FHS family L-fucose permease-like MFS transporter [Polymorphobacter fuscus]
MAVTAAPPGHASSDESVSAPGLQAFMFALFFIFGGITSLNDVLIPKLKGLFALNYAQAMLVQSAFFAAYLVVSLPAAAIVQRLGYLRTATVGLGVMTTGCLLFLPATASAQYPMFLFALFVLAAGITIVQVVANPLMSLLGPVRTASSRLTFAQAFNALGTTVFPYVGAILILGSLGGADPAQLAPAERSAYLVAESAVIRHAYLGLAAALLLVAAAVWAMRNRLADVHARGPVLQAFDLLRRRRFALGALSIFLYVGAEVAIGSLIVSFLMAGDVMGLGGEAAGRMLALYWGGALVGRFIGSFVLRLLRPGLVLAGVSAAAITLLLLAATLAGPAAGWALLAIGLTNAIMFPTIFSLAIEGLGPRAAEGSGIICMAIVGGAVIPPLTGVLADAAGLRVALVLPALCYLVITGYGMATTRGAARG